MSKSHWSGGVETRVADNISFDVPDTGAVALIGRNGAGKSTLLSLISGQLRPDGGRIDATGSVSWPIAFAGSFHGDLSGADNARFVARIHGIRSDAFIAHVREVSELGHFISQPFRTYSSGMKARLAFAVSMAIDFDTLLIDEVMSVGDARFREKSEAILLDRLSRRAGIIVSHNMALLERLCSAAIVLEDGRVRWFDDVGSAVAHHRASVAVAAV